ncbi:hypothetical protein BBJ28_00021566, partial [Nothophytophthora sp. Chile5]
AQHECGALRRERDATRADCEQAQQRLATVASALGHLPGQPVPPKRFRSAPVAGGSVDPDVAYPRKFRRIAVAPKEEPKTKDAGVVTQASTAPGNAIADDSYSVADGSQKSGASDDRGAGNVDDQAGGDNSGEGGISSDDDAVRVALTLSRSDVRRPSVESPGSAESSILLEGSGVASDASEQEWTPSGPTAASSPSADTSRLPAVFTCVPGFDRACAFRADKITTWIPSEIGGFSVTGLTVEILSKRRLHRPGFHFGIRCKAPPRSAYKSSLITGDQVTRLMATEPWSVLDVRVPALTFDPNLSMGDLAEAYCRLEDTYRQAYWESTHYLPITGAMRQADPTLDAYRGERKQRRSHAGGRWKKILAMILRLMRDHLCDLDLLLGPFFLQFPALSESGFWYPGIEDGADPATLLDALVISGAADPWRNHHRDAMADHPSMDILRLEDKFVPKPLAAP